MIKDYCPFISKRLEIIFKNLQAQKIISKKVKNTQNFILIDTQKHPTSTPLSERLPITAYNFKCCLNETLKMCIGMSCKNGYRICVDILTEEFCR